MKKIQLLMLVLAGFVVTSRAADGFADSVVSYDPGTGYVAGFTNVSAVLGEPSTINPYGDATDVFDPPYGTNQILSIGAGGSLTVEFKRPVLHHPRNPFGIDFIIFGDAFFIVTNDVDSNYNWIGTPATDGSLYPFSPGETRVSVSRDGKEFYVLNPALAPAVDGLYPTEGSGDFHKAVDPILTQADFAGLTEAEIQALYNGSGGGTGYDISWAQDSKGRQVWLPEIRFIRVEVLSGHSEVDAFSAVSVLRDHDCDDDRCR
jgi:hypothetical protein